MSKPSEGQRGPQACRRELGERLDVGEQVHLLLLQWSTTQLPTFANAVDFLFIIMAIFTAAGIILAMFFPSGRASAASAAPKTEMLTG